MPKGLRLKKTPTEQVEHDMRRARRAAKKAAHRQYRAHDGDFDSDGRSSKRSRTVGDDGVNLDPSFSGPEPSPLRDGAHTVVEEEIFQEKLWNALGEDERLDGIEARLNEDVYVPRRWRGISSQASSSDTVGGPGDNPNIMNDDEYAEWVRAGMRRKRDAAAHREQERQRVLRAWAQAEIARVLKTDEDARRRARHERKRRRHADALDAYKQCWVGLLESKSKSADLGFGDIPWPVPDIPPDLSQITAEAVSAFLFFPEEGLDEAERGRTRKEELRGTMLRFHPDKFEGRVIPQVKHEERAAVREGANAVTRAITALMADRGDIT
ncbi:hypothetical protein DFH94DRAFT_324690 [Russula ochroleuca]|uniref:NF-kappa-B inhibitor-like protein 1 n=1 Tax=Russula ochroleuca TaxID=152965 RepID=A0A9P5N1P8_9AGAM|nr:hypothetical protein DFH94DRAFT_324690 [Russula ochroleuca]